MKKFGLQLLALPLCLHLAHVPEIQGSPGQRNRQKAAQKQL